MFWNWQNRQEATIRVAIYANVNTANNGKTSDANTRGARVTSGSGKHRSPCECGDTPWNVRLTQKNRPLAGYRPLGPIVAVVVLIAIFDDRPL